MSATRAVPAAIAKRAEPRRPVVTPPLLSPAFCRPAPDDWSQGPGVSFGPDFTPKKQQHLEVAADPKFTKGVVAQSAGASGRWSAEEEVRPCIAPGHLTAPGAVPAFPGKKPPGRRG